VPTDELARRRAALAPRREPARSAYGELYARHVTQANLGCDFDFVPSGRDAPEPYID
jgi:dihydroxy-acid dehydratase